MSEEEKRPCRNCTKPTLGWTTEGMGERSLKPNTKYIEGKRVLLCLDCIHLME